MKTGRFLRGLSLQGDLLLIAAGAPAVVHKSLDRVRQYIAASLGEAVTGQHNLSWVTGNTSADGQTHV